MNQSIADIRKDYRLRSLNEHEVAGNPVTQFGLWWADAVSSQIDEVNAMTLATCDSDGNPSARILLLKGIEENGFVFFTNYSSRKGIELEENPKACMVFFWKELERQVRIEGSVSKISSQASDEYFNSRPAESRIGAWSSPQSQVIENREVLEENVFEMKKKFSEGNIPRPEHWGGYILVPSCMEFWQGRPSRLHDRILYTKERKGWKIERLAP